MSARGEAPGSLLSLDGRVALVAGGRGGIGAAVAALLARAGAATLVTDLPGAGGSPEEDFLPCDLTEPAAVKRLLEEIAARHGRLDVVVHCAGIARDAVLWKLSDEDWSSVLRVNLDSAFLLLRAAVPLMRATGPGAIVLVSSINGERGKRGQANYAASKAGLMGLGRTAARELGRFGIRVNMVAPGLIRTRMSEVLPPAAVERARDEAVLGRLGEPEDVARSVLFLASDLSQHVTGQVLRVDGGQLIV